MSAWPPPYSEMTFLRIALFDQAAFHHRVDALVAVDELRYAQVAGEAAEHISLLGVPSLELDEPADHVAQRLLGGVVKVRIEAERDVVGRRQRPRHREAAFMQDELERSGEAGFQR